MAKCKVLAFLLCENATKSRDDKVTLHGLFDRIIIPRTPGLDKLFFVYYKIVADGACTVSLKIMHSSGQEIPGNWRDSFSYLGPVQSIWGLVSSLFKQPGNYVLELRQEIEGSEPLSLVSMLFVVDQEGE
jgi:hypothetical protein